MFCFVDVRGNKASSCSWYPSTFSFESSAKNYGRWTENLNTDFEVADNGNRADSDRPDTRSDTGLERPPLSGNQWKNFLKNGSDIPRAIGRLNEKALQIITEWGAE